MRRDIHVAAGYLTAMAFLIYGIANPGVGYGSDIAALIILGALILLHLGTGLLAKRWWVVLLPLLPILIAVPAGYPEKGREPIEIWVPLAFWVAPLGAILIAFGLLVQRARRTWADLLRPRQA